MSERERLDVTLPPDLAVLVREAVDSGHYATGGDVVREALVEWSVRRGLEGIRSRIAEARRDVVEGRVADADQVLDRLGAKYRNMR